MHDSSCVFLHFRGVAQSGLARLLREQEVGGSNPPIPTYKMKKKRIIKKDGRYLIYYTFDKKTESQKKKDRKKKVK